MVLIMWKCLLLFVPLCALTAAKTVRYEIETCDGAERKILAARLVGGKIRGLIECRYAPQAPNYVLAIRFNSLNLQRSGGHCPTLTIKAYTVLRVLKDIDEGGFPILDRGIKEPSDPKVIASIDCNNYKQKINTHVQTEQLGQKIQMEYDTKLTSKTNRGGFDITLTSYAPGRSYSCEANHYRCWSQKYMCIDSSLECDYEANCNDNSDEDSFKCTGKIAGIHLPLFIIILVLLILLIIGIIVGLVLYQRRRRQRNLKARQAQQPMDHRAMQPLYTSMQHDPSVVPPEASIAPSSVQYSAYGDRA